MSAVAEGTMYPCLFYNDAPAAIDWLKRVFGFRELMVVPGEGGTIAHSELAIGGGVIMVGSANRPGRDQTSRVSPRDLPGVNQSCYVLLSDVRAHFEHAKSEGAEITIEYNEPDYGGAGYSANDLEGHTWSFGSYAPDLNAGSPK